MGIASLSRGIARLQWRAALCGAYWKLHCNTESVRRMGGGWRSLLPPLRRPVGGGI